MPIAKLYHSNPKSAVLAPVSTKPVAPEPQPNQPPVDALLVAFLMIYHAVLMNTQTAHREAKQLNTNAGVQNLVILEEQGFNYVIPANSASIKAFLEAHPLSFKSDMASLITMKINGGKSIVVHFTTKTFNESVKEDVVKHIMLGNTGISTMRTYFEGKLNLVRQSAQIEEANLNTSANQSSNSLQEGSSITQMLLAVSNEIAQI